MRVTASKTLAGKRWNEEVNRSILKAEGLAEAGKNIQADCCVNNRSHLA